MTTKSRENEGQEQMRETLEAQPKAPGQTEAEKAAAEEAEARQKQAEEDAKRTEDAMKRRREADEREYQESIKGQELPPSVQEAQKNQPTTRT